MHIRAILTGVAAAGAALLLVGCTSAGQSSSASSSSSSSSGPAIAAAAAVKGAAGAGAAATAAPASAAAAAKGGVAPGPAAGTQVLPLDRQIIRTAAFTVRIDVPGSGPDHAEADQRALERAVASAGVRVQALVGATGYVSDSNGTGATVSYTLRVTGRDYQGVVDGLGTLGTVVSRKESSQDVTLQVADVAGRIDSAQRTIAQIKVLLGKATAIDDVLSVEKDLASREADLDALLRQQAALADQVSLSTVTVVLQGNLVQPPAVVAAAPPAPPGGFTGGLRSGWHGVRNVIGVAAVTVGAVLPFVPGIALLAGAAWWWRRRRGGPARVPTVSGGAAD